MKRAASHWALSLAFAVGAAAPSLADPADGNALEEIVVTAQKREQSLQNVPISVTALSGTSLRDAGVITMEGVSRMVPSLTTIQNDAPIDQSYRIRGIGSDPNIPTFEPDVGLFIDGAYLPRSGLGVEDLVDLERIEVLSGPQSTLYGKNVTAGVINLVTKAPSKTFEAHVAVSGSELDGARTAGTVRTEGSISGPLGDSVRARVTGVYYDQGATFENLAPGAPDPNNMQRYAVRGVVDIDLSADTRLTLTGARTELLGTRMQDPDMLYYGVTPLEIDQGLGPLFGSGPCPDNNPKDRIVCTTTPYRSSSSTDIATATLSIKLGANTLTSITAWSNYSSKQVQDDADELQIPLLGFHDYQSGDTLTQEIRIASPGGEKIDWLAGAYYLHSTFARGDDGHAPTFILQEAAPDLELAPGIPFGQPGDAGFIDSHAMSDYFAMFGQVSYHLNEQFVVTGGLRWQTETKTASIDNSNSFAADTPDGINLITAALTPTSVNGSFRHETDGFPWSASAEYHPDKDTMIYLTYARGGKSGGFNIGFGTSPREDRPFGDETVDSYEVGTKWTSPERRVRLSAAVFDTIYHNYQNAGFVALQFLVNNAEKATTRGFEASADFALAEGLTLSTAGTYIDAKYNQYTNGSCYAGLAPTNAAGTGCDLSGKALPLVPDWRTSVGLQYAHQLKPGEFYGRLDWSWSSNTQTNTNLDPRNIQAAYSLVNLRLGLRFHNGLDASVWAKNLANETYVIQSAVSNLFSDDPSYQAYLGNPREIGVTLRKQF